ncbi:MAG: rhomboid family intramembrane serine protease [Ectothiorhodospiraceae bacterium]
MIPVADDTPTRSRPWIGWLIMGACIAVFFWQAGLPPRAYEASLYGFGFIPSVFFGEAALPPQMSQVPTWLTPLTAMFLHGGFLHLAGNMLYLWVFANNVEDAMGHIRFVVFYVLCGVIATMAHALAAMGSDVPMIGASGAISGVLGAYLLLHPWSWITVVIPLGLILYPARLPAALVLVVWFVMQVLSSAGADPEQPGVAFMAHIGGFVAGMALVPWFKNRRVRLLRGPRR